MKRANSHSLPEQILQIQSNLNLCGNINIKQYLLLFEAISKKFPFNKNISFNWRTCFKDDGSDDICPQSLKKSFQVNFLDTRVLISVLNKTHYANMKPSDAMKSILRIIGNSLSTDFNPSVLNDDLDEDFFMKEG